MNEKRSRGKEAMERLTVRLSEIGRYQVKFSVYVLVGFAVWYVALLIWFKGDTKRTNEVFTNSFQFMAVAWCCWFMLPYFLRVEAKQDVSLAMGHDSVDVLDKIDTEMNKRLTRIDKLIQLAENAADPEKAQFHPILKKCDEFLTELRYIRIEVSKTTGRKAELDEALDEGEQIAALIRGEIVLCPRDGNPMVLENNGIRDIAFCERCSRGVIESAAPACARCGLAHDGGCPASEAQRFATTTDETDDHCQPS